MGNILKDVYLGLDPRSEHFERDKHSVGWLDLSFDASQHHFFRRTSSFGGAAVSLEVLHQLGLAASVSNSDFTFSDTPSARQDPPEVYRYILTHDDQVAYFTPSHPCRTQFTPPTTPPDYLYLDRSAALTSSEAAKIVQYLKTTPSTKLVIYAQDHPGTLQALSPLFPLASLVFFEQNRGGAELSDALASNDTAQSSPKSRQNHPLESIVPKSRIITLTDTTFTYQGISQSISVSRIDTLTHLSFYSIAAATILGSFILGDSVETALHLAKLNVENSSLSATLPLSELRRLAADVSQHAENLELIAASLVRPGKGILAADESGGSIAKKFAQLHIPDTFENRHAYRDIFFTTPDLEKYLSGVILFDETARDHASSGQTYVDFLTAQRLIPGIKVDQGLEKFPDSEETYTKGLDGLPQRLEEYHEMGLRFAKWRAAFNLTLDDFGNIVTPTDLAITENAKILATYAKDCQNAGLVPIVEPEVIYDGYYTIEKCAEATGRVLDALFQALKAQKVNLRACLLKVNMVLAGKQMHAQSTPQQVGRATAAVLRQHVPVDLAGVVFLSGGQNPAQATTNLAAVLEHGPFPWPVTFSFARALQDPALFAWQGQPENIKKARRAFAARLTENGQAIAQK